MSFAWKLKLNLTVLVFIIGGALAGCGSSNPSSPQATQPKPASATPSPAPTANVKLDVPYVPTPHPVVAKMLEMAKVNKNDVVYDLGSGDGRIVITAAKERGASGVGYDINPERIKESNENARREGVADRVRFTQEDLFKADLSGATVVTLYLLPEVNLKLRPKLLSELKPGTRIVSHNYDMGDWKPQNYAEMDIDGTKHYVYFWVVPPRKQ